MGTKTGWDITEEPGRSLRSMRIHFEQVNGDLIDETIVRPEGQEAGEAEFHELLEAGVRTMAIQDPLTIARLIGVGLLAIQGLGYDSPMWLLGVAVSKRLTSAEKDQAFGLWVMAVSRRADLGEALRWWKHNGCFRSLDPAAEEES